MDRPETTIDSAGDTSVGSAWAENHARGMGERWKKYCILNEDICAKIKNEIENLEMKKYQALRKPPSKFVLEDGLNGTKFIREIPGEKPPFDEESWTRLFQKLELKLMKTERGEWEEIAKNRPPLPRYPTKAQRRKHNAKWRKKNRLLIHAGLACWKYQWDESVLVTGYKLRSNPKIYKAVFQHHREEFYFELRKEVKLFGRFIAAKFRQILYYKTLMDIPELKIIPRFIIMKIANLTSDPITYSYLSS